MSNTQIVFARIVTAVLLMATILAALTTCGSPVGAIA
jgi:hypothetical protein